MIILKAVKKIGEAFPQDKIENLISPFSKGMIDENGQLNVVAITVDINNMHDFKINTVKKENDPKKFLYRAIIGSDKTIRSPSVKLAKGKKSVEEQLLDKYVKYSERLAHFKGDFFEKFSEFISQNMKSICSAIALITSNPPDGDYLVSFIFKDGEKELYPIEIKEIRKVFLSFDSVKKGKPIICSVCGGGTSSGRRLSDIELFKFSTFDKPGFLPFMNPKNVEKILPVCDACYEKIRNGSNVINEKLNFPFYFKDKVWIIPKSLNDDIRTIKKSVEILSQSDLRPESSAQRRRSLFEKRVFERAKSLSDLVQLDFLFYRQNSSQRQIMLKVSDVSPTFLEELSQKMEKISEKYKNIAGEWFEFSFRSIYDVIVSDSKNKSMENFYKVIFSVLSGRRFNEKLLISSAIGKIRSSIFGNLKKDENIRALVFNTLATMELSTYERKERGDGMFLPTEENALDEKVNEFLGGTLDTSEKKACFYLGVLTGRIISCQSGNGKPPFYKQLKGLRMKEMDFKALYSKIINKMNEYSTKECYFDTKTMNTLKKLCAYSLMASKRWDLDVDEANFIFTSGMILTFSEPLKGGKEKNDEDQSI